MTSDSPFRSSDQEIISLLQECRELKSALVAISAQVSRIERRVKQAFPVIAQRANESVAAKRKITHSTMSSEEALAEFDRIVEIAASGSRGEAERTLEEKSNADLLVIAKELGVNFPNNKPSHKSIKSSIYNKIKESLLLGRHNIRTKE